ncbi:hypothetical protein PJ985_07035 [Streptomyces sp. ACA25]|nr:hypothetical protein [Streptomyces sp. ACA25]MDB1087319.1 hypothetical protein [Streptomyces sp. ACA25]
MAGGEDKNFPVNDVQGVTMLTLRGVESGERADVSATMINGAPTVP